MYKAAVIGDYDSIYGFASAGMKIMSVSGASECAEVFKSLLGKNYGVIFVTEDYAPAIKELITQPVPAVMFIPAQSGNGGYASMELHEMVEKAVGADLL